MDGCKDRYVGIKCEIFCKENCVICEIDNFCIFCVFGRFGLNCEYFCLEICGGSKICYKNSGVCLECNFGMFGLSCI